MTALKQFERLECTGLWRPDPAAQRREVIVSFGDSSLVMTDKAGQALTHWSLAAVARVNPGEKPALYTPSAEGLETLELEDGTMVEAIETVRRAVTRGRPHRGRVRLLSLGGSLLAVLLIVALWLPGALVRHTASVLPEPTRAEIGTSLFRAIGRVAGAPCRSPRGDQALAALHNRLAAPDRGGLLVLPGGFEGTVSLPSGLILINRALVEDHDNPDVLAGYILAEVQRRSSRDPLIDLLEASGTRSTLRLLTTGRMKPDTLERFAESLVARQTVSPPNDALLERFRTASVASTPYAYALDITGESTLPLIEADPMRGGGAQPVLDDGDWVALQQICEG